jgi:hypothetical protein
MSDLAKYAAWIAGGSAALAYALVARRRIRSGRGRGLFNPKVVGVIGLLVLWFVGVAVAVVVELALGNL